MSSGPKKVDLDRRPDPEVVSFLAELLEDAKVGKIHGLAIATSAHHKIAFTGFVGRGPMFELIGAMESLKIQILIKKDQCLREKIWNIIHEEGV